uniref:BMERB domain-containing protein n=1 Tax=Steinernema glaseri TaxID=37863 RepID=A0A1I8AK67_9BILA
MGTASVENGDRARAHSSAADNSAIPFADDTPEQRQSSGWLRSKLPALMRKGRSTSKGRPSSVTVVPVDPDVFDERRQQTEKSELGGQVEEERRVEKISTGPTTCISILPDNQMPCCPQHKTRVFTCSICVGLASSVSVPSMKTKIPLSATLKNIQRIKLEMEKYRSNVEHEKTLMAQELQRKISETESRLQDVIVTGSDLEYLLKTKTGTSWTLERWVEYLQEYKMLNLKLEDLHIRVKEMQLNNEYAEIQRQMASICTSSLGVMPVGMNEKRTRENSARLIALFDQRQAFHDQRITINKKWEDVRNNSDTTITEQGKDFQNFTPVFSELKLQMNSQNPC